MLVRKVSSKRNSFRSEYFLCVEIENAVGENETKSETLMFLDLKCASLSQTLSTQLETGNSVMNFESVSGGDLLPQKCRTQYFDTCVFGVILLECAILDKDQVSVSSSKGRQKSPHINKFAGKHRFFLDFPGYPGP